MKKKIRIFQSVEDINTSSFSKFIELLLPQYNFIEIQFSSKQLNSHIAIIVIDNKKVSLNIKDENDKFIFISKSNLSDLKPFQYFITNDSIDLNNYTYNVFDIISNTIQIIKSLNNEVLIKNII